MESTLPQSVPGPALWISAIAALLLAFIHIIACRLRFLDAKPRSRWLSVGNGVSVAYIFVHVLPALSVAQEDFADSIPMLSAIKHHVYVVALVGMLIFYVLERAAQVSRQKNSESGVGDVTHPGVFWFHMAFFALYNALIGYLLTHREAAGIYSLAVYVFAMALHFVVNDFSLSEDHKLVYCQKGRWILSFAVVFGWVAGAQSDVSEAIAAVLFSFLAGGIILNVLKEELPQAKESRFWPFAAGALGYSGLLLFL